MPPPQEPALRASAWGIKSIEPRRWLTHKIWGTDAPSSPKLLRGLALALVWLASLALCLNLSTTQFALLAAALLLAVDSVLRPREFWQRVAPLRAIWAAYFCLLAAVVVSLVATPVGFAGMGFIGRSRAWLAPLPIALVMLHAGPQARQVAVWCLMVGAAIAGTLGVVQFYTGVHPGAELLGIPQIQWQIQSPVDPSRFSAVGFFYNRTRFAHVMVLPVCLGIGQLATVKSWRRRLIVGGLWVPSVAGFVLSYTRAAFLAVVVAGAVVAVLMSWKHVRVQGARLIPVLVIAVTVLLLVPSVRGRVLSSLDLAANADRIFLWQQASLVAEDFGATGIGFAQHGVVRQAYHDVADPYFAMRAQDHNLYLSFLVEMGPLGLLTFMLLLVAVLHQARRRLGEPGVDPSVLGGLVLSVLAYILLSSFHDPPYQAVEAIALFWPVALIASDPLETKRSGMDIASRSSRGFRSEMVQYVILGLAAIALAFFAPPALVGLVVVIGLATWLPRVHSLAHAALRLVLALGLSMLCFCLPIWGLALLAVPVLLSVPWLRREAGFAVMAAALALSFPLLMVALAGRDGAGLLFAQSAVALACVALAMQAVQRTRRAVRGSGLALAGMVAVGLAWRWSSWQPDPNATQTAYRLQSVAGVRAGHGQQVSDSLLERICRHLDRQQVPEALTTLRLAGILRPGRFLGPEGMLWQAELRMSEDLRITERIVDRALRRHGSRQLVEAIRPRGSRFTEAVVAWASRSHQFEFVAGLNATLADSTKSILSCKRRQEAPGSSAAEQVR